MHLPTLDELRRALHIRETMERLKAEMADILGEKIPMVARDAGNTVLDLFGVGGQVKKTPRFSKAARARIAAAQKRRWARVKGATAKPVATKPMAKARKKKSKMSAAGRAAIVAAQKARWAKVKAERAKAAK